MNGWLEKTFSRVNDRFFCAAVAIVIVIFSWLSLSTYDINFWPTDSWLVYIPAANKILSLDYISQIHTSFEWWFQNTITYGKESFILAIAVFQGLLNDNVSLFPNIFLLITSVCLSALLIYLILKRLFDAPTAFVGFVLFTTTFWPYVYVLQGAHPPFALMMFLLVCYFFLEGLHDKGYLILAGLFAGLLIFASPTALFYGPYYVGLLVYLFYTRRLSSQETNRLAPWFVLPALAVVIVFFLPDPIKTLDGFMRFMRMAQESNHFADFREDIIPFFPGSVPVRGGGIKWISHYAFLVMPVLFCLYLTTVVFSLIRLRSQPQGFWLVVLSLSTPIIVEAFQLVQFGRTYFPWFLGMILLVSYVFKSVYPSLNQTKYKKGIMAFFGAVLLVHITFNIYVFVTDIYPSRMSTNYVYDWLKTRKVSSVNSLLEHRYNRNVIQFLNNPKQDYQITFNEVSSIKDAKSGYIIIPPVTPKSIWCNCRLQGVYTDVELKKLLDSGRFQEFVVAQFPTLSSSRIWTQEEEICTYRDLILNQISREDRQMGYVWILDAQKLQREWF